jgi:hypothetical protein
MESLCGERRSEAVIHFVSDVMVDDLLDQRVQLGETDFRKVSFSKYKAANARCGVVRLHQRPTSTAPKRSLAWRPHYESRPRWNLAAELIFARFLR